MTDIELAKKYLNQGNLAIAVVKDKELIFKSKDKGIKPMYILATQMEGRVKGSSIADRVIGKAAAMLSIYLGIEEVYGKLMSKRAVEILRENNIPCSYDELSPYIENRDRTDICPVEKIALKVEKPEELIGLLRDFLG
ncbi:MAG: DUF1893 domain-containing protein [Tissierellia bacterium]|nr:DUF1893 domain-containing protein [Tissierellia bacterium]